VVNFGRALAWLLSSRPGALLPVFLFVPACGTGRSSRVAVRIDTLTSGTVVVHNPERGMWGERSTWTLTDAVIIGSQSETGTTLFGQVADIALDRSGRVYVLDRMAAEIQVFGPDGSYIRTIGRAGHGPGEFAIATGMRFDPRDRLWVLNAGNQRYSVFDTNGALVREFPRRTTAMVLEWRDGVFSPVGDLYDDLLFPTESGWHPGCVRYDTITTQFVDTLPCPVLPEGTPFGWGRIVPTPRGWWVGVAGDYRLWELTRAGDTVRVIERAYQPAGLSRPERDSIRDAMSRLRQRAGGAAGLPVPEQRRVFDVFIVDDLGYLWVQRSRARGDRTTIFDVFDSDGRYLGSVTTPYVVEPRPPAAIRGDRMAFVTTDEVGAQSVVTARIRGRR
jgi:hypothetical protein